DLESGAELLTRHRARFEGSEEMALAHARALAALGWNQEASGALHAFFRAHPGAQSAGAELASLYADAPSPEPIEALERGVREHASHGRRRGAVSSPLADRRRGDRRYAEANEALEPALAELPKSVNARRLYADNCVALRDFAGALAKLDEAVAMSEGPGPAD